MKRSELTSNGIGGIDLWITVAATAIATLLIVAATPAHAQTYTVLHTFNGSDGAFPYGTLTMDRAGNLYGTTYGGGSGCNGYGCGTVFKLTHKNSGWILTPLYKFQAGDDGEFPTAGVTLGPDGSLYGTTNVGGGGPCAPPTGGLGCGTVFNLRPPATACNTALCPWTETVLYRFTGGSDGAYPGYGNLVFDQAGNVYGTTEGDEDKNAAVVFELAHSKSGWTKSLVYSFGTAAFVGSGVILDTAVNLYGTTGDGGSGYGSVYEMTPSGSGWTESTLYTFHNNGDGYDPLGGVAFDQKGNLYGTTFNDGGRVFELRPSNGSWIYSSLHYFGGYEGSYSGPTLDAAGNVYGTLSEPGTAFELTRSNGWLETDLSSLPVLPVGGVTLDANGNIYGTASLGGSGHCDGNQCGVVFEITP
ncbi:MAG: choice-of-anchor tandem repeat GloVer-containing protein [Candidatus Korobacteraceae bacterium]|jgi:uncharacterized repeat protein (TIGR03803 family)